VPDGAPPPLPFDPPAGGIAHAVGEHLGTVHQVSELRRELGAYARSLSVDRQINADEHKALQKRIDDAKGELAELVRSGFARLEQLLTERAHG
jgi:ribosome recycling factor